MWPRLKVTIARTWDEFEDIRPDWIALLQDLRRPSPFLDPDFCEIWLRYREESAIPFIVGLESPEEGLLGLLPFSVLDSRKGGVRLRRLRFAVTASYLDSDFLVKNLRDSEVADAVSYAFGASEADMIDLHSFPSASRNVFSVEQAMRKGGLGFRICHSMPWRNAVVRLDRSWDEYLSTRSAKLRYNLRRAERKLMSLGRIRVERHRHPSDMDGLLRDINTIIESSWKRHLEYVRGTFWGEVLHLLDRRGWLEAHVLRLDDHPVAFLLLLREGKTVYSMQTAYDTDYSEGSPGTYLIYKALDAIFKQPEGQVRMDFLTNYQYLIPFSDYSCGRVGVQAFSRSIRGRIISLLFALRSRRRQSGQTYCFRGSQDVLARLSEEGLGEPERYPVGEDL